MDRSSKTRRHKFRITGQRSRRFLETLAETGNVTAAAAAAGISRGGAYDHRQIDDAFAAAWREAEEIAADRLESEAWRRAVDGVSEPVISMGKLVRDDNGEPVTIQRYSDNLLLSLLRAHRPEKFRDRTSHEHTGGPFLLEQIVLLSLEKREEPPAAQPLVIDATPVSGGEQTDKLFPRMGNDRYVNVIITLSASEIRSCPLPVPFLRQKSMTTSRGKAGEGSAVRSEAAGRKECLNLTVQAPPTPAPGFGGTPGLAASTHTPIRTSA
jgi:hypothetical protein